MPRGARETGAPPVAPPVDSGGFLPLRRAALIEEGKLPLRHAWRSAAAHTPRLPVYPPAEAEAAAEEEAAAAKEAQRESWHRWSLQLHQRSTEHSRPQRLASER